MEEEKKMGAPMVSAFKMEDLKSRKTIDFGTVQPGRKTKTIFKIDSPYMVTDVTPSSLQSPLDKAIFLNQRKALTSYDGKLHFTYRPSLPNQNSVDVYYLAFEDKTRLALVVKGRTKTTRVILSPSRIQFETTGDQPRNIFQVYLTNTSQANDYYQWDLTDDNCYQLDIRPNCGKIKAGEKVKVVVTISPKQEGFYYRQIFCLFKFQEPVSLEIYGHHSKSGEKADPHSHIFLNETLPTFRTEFCRYVSDCSRQIFPESRLLLVLSERYLDFGGVKFSGVSSSLAKSFTLSNQGLKTLTIIWDNDNHEVFHVEPRVEIIPSGKSQRFLVSFTPTHALQFYCCDLIASVLWGSQLDFLVPSSVTISVAGHSFSGICGWMTSFKVDRTEIILPATVPYVPVYTTFRVSRTGSLPIFFRLFPADPTKSPEQSNFVLKPLQGLVNEKFRIVIVQFSPEAKCDVDVIEEWYLCINTSVKIKLKICGTSQLPYVLIGNDKLIEFPPTTIGTRMDLLAPIRNTTRLNLKYKLLDDGEEEEKELGPGEQSDIRLHFVPKSGPQEFQWAETVQVIWSHGDRNISKILQGQLIHARTVVQCRGRSVVSSVDGYPKMITLDNVVLGRTTNTTLGIKNDGDGPAYLALSIKSRVFDSEKAIVEINPSHLVLQPLQSVRVRVNILNRTIGRNNFEIIGQHYLSSLFDQKIDQECTLTMIEVYCSFPTVKVIDINYEGIISNLSKLSLWNLLRINELNDCFKNAHLRQYQSTHMQIPAGNQNSKKFKFQLLLQSDSAIPMTVAIAPLKSCSCTSACVTAISRRVIVPNCPHVGEITARLSCAHLKPCEKTVLTFKVRYNVPLLEPFRFALTIHPTDDPRALKTVITLFLKRPLIPPGHSQLHLSIPIDTEGFYRWKLEPVYVGDNSKYVQILWLWNESDHDLNYSVQLKSGELKIFELLNSQGRIDSSCSYPLLLQCKAFEFKMYTAEMVIKCTNTEDNYTVRVYLDASTQPRYDSRHVTNRMPVLPSFPTSEMVVEMSPQHLCLPSMPTHSYIRRLFFLKNHTQDTLIFNWLNRQVWGTLKATVSPSKGCLQPEEIKSLTVQVHSYRFPAKATFDVQCAVLNVSQYRDHNEKVKHMKKASTIFDASFTLRGGDRLEEGHYEPPKRCGVRHFKQAGSFFISLGVTVHVFDDIQLQFVCPKAEQQLSLTPQLKADVSNSRPPALVKMVLHIMPDMAIDVIRRAMGDILKSSSFRLVAKVKTPKLKYATAAFSPYRDTQSKARQVNLQAYHMGSLMGHAIHSVLAAMFDFCETIEALPYAALENEVVSDKRQLHNAYYQDILLENIK